MTTVRVMQEEWGVFRNLPAVASRFTEETGIDLPYHRAVYRILFEGEDPRTILDVLV